MDMIYWDHYNNQIIFLNLLIVVGLFTCLRLFFGIISHVNASDELLRKDNPAFGISLAATTFALTIMLSGAIYGSPENDALHSVISVGAFGIAGIVLLALTRSILGRVVFPAMHIRDQIVNGNKAVAIADAGNIIAAAIIIRAVMVWVDVYSLEGMLALIGGYAASQFILTAMTLVRMKAFQLIDGKTNLQDELKNGNIALALRFSGQKVGTAFAIATAAQIVVYEEYDVAQILVAWIAASILALTAWKIICFFAERIILFRVNTHSEIVEQRNIAVGALQAVIYISLGLLLSAL